MEDVQWHFGQFIYTIKTISDVANLECVVILEMQLENLINCRISETTNHPKTTTNKPVFPNKLILLESEKVASPKAFLMTDQSNQSNTNHTDFEDHTTNLCEIKRLDDNYYSDNGKKYSNVQLTRQSSGFSIEQVLEPIYEEGG